MPITPHFIISHSPPFFIGMNLPTNRATLLSRTISYFKTIVWMYLPVEQSPDGTLPMGDPYVLQINILLSM
jgi:hypothetical protein